MDERSAARNPAATPPSLQTPTASLVTDAAIELLRNAPENKPRFLCLTYFDPHPDYRPPAAYRNRFGKPYGGKEDGRIFSQKSDFTKRTYDSKEDLARLTALYDGEIRYVDDEIARFLQRAREERLLASDTLIVITSPMGQEFNEHGGLGHGRTLHEECIRVPLILHRPAVLAPRVVEKGLASTLDIMPTVLHEAGIPAVAGCGGRPLAERSVKEETVLLHVDHLDTWLGAQSPAGTVLYRLRGGMWAGYLPESSAPLPQAALAENGELQKMIRAVKSAVQSGTPYAVW